MKLHIAMVCCRLLSLLLASAALATAAVARGSPPDHDGAQQVNEVNNNEPGVTEQLQDLIEKRDVSVQLGGATVTVSPR
ncbi:hypothetical protein, partial [Escherichia coli]|uniref:hypothetical protein n=1 Tax=Escherichia coli TaxID=562 RepID=UPI002540AA4B